MFDLYYYHLKKKSEYYSFANIDQLFLKLGKVKHTLKATDQGAGTLHHGIQREIGKLSLTSSVSKKYGEILFKLVNKFQPRSILELGTAFGKSTAYMASAATKAQIISVDADQNIQTIAANNLQKLNIRNVQLINTQIDEFLGKRGDERFDFVFIDANHTYQATMRYFESLMGVVSCQAVLVFDDIYWSKEMTRAWKQISADSRSIVSVDLFQFGVVFLGKPQAKEYFKLRL